MILAISLDLKGAATEYVPLYTHLKRHFKGWSHYMPSTWFVETDDPPARVVDGLRDFLGKTDRCFVVVAGEYEGLLPERAWRWFRNHKKEGVEQLAAPIDYAATALEKRDIIL